MDCADLTDWEAMAAMLSPLKGMVAAIPTLPPVTLETPAPPTHSPAVAAIPTLPTDVLARIAANKKAAEDRRSDRAWEKAKALMASLDIPCSLLKIALTPETPAPPTHSPAVAVIPTLSSDVLARIAANKKAAEDRRSDRAWEKAKALMASLDQPPSSKMPPNTRPAPESAPATRFDRLDPNLVQLLAVKEQASLTRRALQDIDVIERRERKKCRFGHVDLLPSNNFATGVLLTKTENEYMSACLALEEMEKTIENLEKGYRVSME